MRRSMLAATSLGSAALLAVQGCAAGAATGDAGHIRDSAGIAIVDNTAPAWDERTRWRLTDEPVLDIGGKASDPHYDFLYVAGATRLSDGRIVVANGGTTEIRVYDPAGGYVATIGRRGGGPGEFQGLTDLRPMRGDSVLVYDFQARRLTTFDPSGEVARTMPVPLADDRMLYDPIGQLAGGSWLALGIVGYSPGVAGGARRDSVLVVRADAALRAVVDTLLWLPGTETFVVAGQDFVQIHMLPFGRNTSLAFGDDRLYVGDNDRYEVAVYDSAGALVRLIRRAVTRQPVTPADVERAKRAELDETEARWRPNIEEKWAKMPIPTRRPAYGGILLDRSGNLWVQHDQVLRTDSIGFAVFGPDGRLLGDVAGPPGLMPFEIGDDYVLGSWRDEDGVEHVRVYRLVKSA